MGLFSKREKRADEPTAETTLVDDVVLKALLTGEDIDTAKALTIPAVQSAVNKISTLVAVLPIKLYKREPLLDKDEKPTGKTKAVEITDDKRTYFLNVDSGDTLDQFAIKRNIARDYLLDKGGFLYIDKKGTEWNGLRYLPPKTVNANVNATNPIMKDGQYLVMGKTYEQYQLISVLRDTDDGFLGKPLTKQINDVLATAVSNILYEMGIVKKGGTKKGFLQSDKELSQPAMNALKKAWRELYSNTSENVIVLNKGLTFQEASDNSVDLQIDQRKKSLFTEISEIFGIHSDKFDDFFRDAVLPVLEAIESALNKNFLLESEKQDHFWQFDKREILKAEIKTRYEAYELANKTGFLSKNEIRDAENLEPIEGLDVVSMNLADVLFDIKTQTFYTPNTGDMTDLKDKLIADKAIGGKK